MALDRRKGGGEVQILALLADFIIFLAELHLTTDAKCTKIDAKMYIKLCQMYIKWCQMYILDVHQTFIRRSLDVHQTFIRCTFMLCRKPLFCSFFAPKVPLICSKMIATRYIFEFWRFFCFFGVENNLNLNEQCFRICKDS